MRATLVAGLVLLVTTAVNAVDYRALLPDERAREFATHVATVREADLSNTTAGQTQSVTLATFAANSGAEFSHWKLITPFVDTNLPTANTNLFCMVGTTASTNVFHPRASIASANVPVVFSFGTSNRSEFAISSVARAVFEPGPTNALSQMTAGEIKFFFKYWTVP